MTTLAGRFGVSGSYLARVCTVLNVPRPERGYWAKLAVNKAPMPEALPDARPGDQLHWSKESGLALPPPRPSLPVQRTRGQKRVPRAVHSGTHAVLVGARAHFENSRSIEDGAYLKPYKKLLVDVPTSRACLDKALTLANDLFNALETAGHRVMLASGNNSLRRADIDERLRPGKPRDRYYHRSIWSPDRPTIVYVGAVAVGLTVVEMSEDVLLRYTGGKYVREAEYIPPKASRFRADHTFTTTKELPSGRLRIGPDPEVCDAPLQSDVPQALPRRRAALTSPSMRRAGAIDQQDALDALGAPPSDLVDKLSDVDGDWQSFARDTALWLEQMLQFGRGNEQGAGASDGPSPPFRYVYSTANRHTLIPLPVFMIHCADALDLAPNSRGGRSIRTIPYTFRRRTALGRDARARGVGLLRYGDALMSGMTALTEADDRGRSFAMWRFDPDHVGDTVADVYFRFDFVLEADIAEAAETLREHGRDTSSAGAAIRRRGDMALPPFHRSLWLDRELAPVTAEALLARLARPYAVEPAHGGAVDINLNARCWQRVLQLHLPELGFWSDLCGKARLAAEAALCSDPDLIESLARAEHHALRVDLGRIGQLRARARAGADVEDDSELNFEERLASALRDGIRAPSVRVDTVGAVFLSASRDATDRVSGGY